MKSYKDIYKFPLELLHHRVYDKVDNFIFQFEPKFTKDGSSYAEGYKEFEQRVMKAVNGVPQEFKGSFEVKDTGIIYYKGVHVITIRGWGNLTGIGGHNLPAEEAANIQDTFSDFLIESLNKRL